MTNVDLNNIGSPNDQYSSWHKEITETLDHHIPIKKMRVRERDVPYITPEWKDAMRKKRKYAKRYERLQTQESLDKMRYWRNIVTRLRRRAIKNYWRTKADRPTEKSKSFHNVFSPFINSKDKNLKLETILSKNIAKYQES